MADPPNTSVILLVEDEEVLRGLLREHIGTTYPRLRIIEAGDGNSAWNLFRQQAPAYCVVDLRLPGMDGWSLVQLMLGVRLPPRILILTAQMHWRPPVAVSDHKHLFFLDKTSPLGDLTRAMEALISRDASAERRFQLAAAAAEGEDYSGLTRRERQLVSLIGGGLSIREIAGMLGISPHTALTHRKNILRKLGMNSSTQLVRFALESGLSTSRMNRS